MFSKFYRTIPHTARPQNGTESASGDPDYKDTDILRGDRPPSSWRTCILPRITKMPEGNAGQQYQGHEHTWRGYHSPCKSKEVKSKIPMICLHCSLQAGKWAHARVAKGSRIYRTESRPRLYPRPRLKLQSQLRLRLLKVPRPLQRLQSRGLSVCQFETRRARGTPGLLSTWGWCPTVLFIF